MNLIKRLLVILFLFLLPISFAQENTENNFILCGYTIDAQGIDDCVYFLNKLKNSNLEEEFYKNFKDKDTALSYEFPAFAKLFFILKNNNSFKDDKIGAFLYDSLIIKINDEYFDDLSKIDPQKIDKNAKIEVYNKNIFHSIDELKKYEESKKALGKDPFSDYKEYAKFNQEAKQAKSFYIHDSLSVSKEDFEIFELIKDKDYISKADKIKMSIGSASTGCVTFNPKYYPENITKVEKVLNNPKYKEEEKAQEIKDRLEYNPDLPSVSEFAKDIAGRIYYLAGIIVTSTVVFAYPWGIDMLDNATKMMIEYKLW